MKETATVGKTFAQRFLGDNLLTRFHLQSDIESKFFARKLTLITFTFASFRIIYLVLSFVFME